MSSYFWVMLAALAGILTCSSARSAEPHGSADVILWDVDIVDVRSGAVSRSMSVVIGDGRILQISAGRPPGTKASTVVRATGKYLVPGYVDTHIHALNRDDAARRAFPLLIANGVTAIRDENIGSVFEDRAKASNMARAVGDVIAPEVLFSGGEQHLNLARSAWDQSHAGIPSIDHLGAGLGLLLDCSTDEAAIRADALKSGYRPRISPDYLVNPRAFDAAQNAVFYQRVLETFSTAKCTALSQAFARNRTWQTVTLARLRSQDWGDDRSYRSGSTLRYMDRATVEQWNTVADRFAQVPAEARRTLEAYYRRQQQVTQLMFANGVMILAGSDSGAWSVPGFALHDEFRELARAGLPPLAVLQSATLNPAVFLKREDRMGTVEVGKAADLVLLDADPTKSVANLSRISGVVVAGRFLSRRDLDRMKAGVAATP